MKLRDKVLHWAFLMAVTVTLVLPQSNAYAQSVFTVGRAASTVFRATSTGFTRVNSTGENLALAETGIRDVRAAMGIGGARAIVLTDSRSIAVTGGTAAVKTAASVSIVDAAIAIASCLGKVVICAAITAATAAYEAYRARRNADGSGAERDPGEPAIIGQPQDFSATNLASCSGPHRYGPDQRIAAIRDEAACMNARGSDPSFQYVADEACFGPGSPAITIWHNGNIAQCLNPHLYIGTDPGSLTCRNPSDLPGQDGKCPTGSYTPVSEQQLADAVAASPPPWGSGEGGEFNGGGASGRWSDALKEAVEQGNVTPPASIQNSGPATVTGPSTTTDTTTTPPATAANPNPQPVTEREVKTPSSELTYPPGSPSIGVTDTSTTTRTGPNGTTTTQTNAPGTGTSTQPEPAPNDTAMPGQPTLYTRKYPDGITGVWRDKIAGIKATPLFSAAAGMFPGVPQSGTCPVWSLTVPFLVGVSPTVNVAPPCWIWDVAKWVILVSALLLCRALVFGG